MPQATDQSIPIVEVGNVPVIFASACAQIEKIGSCFQLVLCSPAVPVDCLAGTPEQIVRLRLILPAESIATLRRQLEAIESIAIETKPRPELRAVN